MDQSNYRTTDTNQIRYDDLIRAEDAARVAAADIDAEDDIYPIENK